MMFGLAHLHRFEIRPDPYCMLCSLREPTDRNHRGQRTALLNRTVCEMILGDQDKNDGKLAFSFLLLLFL